MSWQGYIDNLIGSGNLDKAAIIGYPEGQVWAYSPGFNLNPSELKAVSGGFGTNNLASTGIVAGGTKYFYLQSDANQIQGRKAQCGISIAKAATCMIIGTYGEAHQPGSARKTVETMADYLRENGY